MRFSGLPQRPAVSLNRGFSAPITLSVEQKAEDQHFLARHDGDLFSRWQAFNTLLTETLIAASRQRSGGQPAAFAQLLVELAGTIAGDESLEHAFRALALTPPGEADIAREIGGNINPDAIFEAREGLVAAIAEGNGMIFRRFTIAWATMARSAPTPPAPGDGRCATRSWIILRWTPAGRLLPRTISAQPPT